MTTAGGASEVARASERTRLSWRRTILSALTVMLLAVSKLLITSPGRVALLLIFLMSLTWFGCLAVAARRMAALRAGHETTVSRSPALLALLVTAYAALATALTAALAH